MIREIDLTDNKQALELLMLQQLSYRIEAQMIGFKEIPPLWDSPLSLKESGESFLGNYEEKRLTGAISMKQTAKELAICRMMVHPQYFRRGIASRLLEFVEGLAIPGLPIKVSTGTNNKPAFSLYKKHGYEPAQVLEVSPGITLTVFYKQTESI
ncbi:Acetyltransferase (GNAT) family protein [Paenibacillus sp. 1_12]|uniref:GNAT family N-acetyltransferase n=1 Tax=Paenibacillus sp. 1_12 TaxID=1566278 RepID=UPI0008DFB540|nr:GNAT family N-acetyltransferase [Paenibacillus sp. 1_12]SFL69495.1 Acetyltransferase (GNAT) family protein [Paenibacillus sp. 1_12]